MVCIEYTTRVSLVAMPKTQVLQYIINYFPSSRNAVVCKFEYCNTLKMYFYFPLIVKFKALLCQFWISPYGDQYRSDLTLPYLTCKQWQQTVWKSHTRSGHKLSGLVEICIQRGLSLLNQAHRHTHTTAVTGEECDNVKEKVYNLKDTDKTKTSRYVVRWGGIGS